MICINKTIYYLLFAYSLNDNNKFMDETIQLSGFTFKETYQ